MLRVDVSSLNLLSKCQACSPIGPVLVIGFFLALWGFCEETFKGATVRSRGQRHQRAGDAKETEVMKGTSWTKGTQAGSRHHEGSYGSRGDKSHGYQEMKGLSGTL